MAFFYGVPSQWDDTGRLFQEAGARAMQGAQNGYRVKFTAIQLTKVTKKKYFRAPYTHLSPPGSSKVKEDMFS